MYIERNIAGLITRARKALPVVALSGPRQAGKSTYLLNDRGLKTARYITLDDTAVLAGVAQDPEGVLSTGGCVVIDEAQRAPALFGTMKALVDRNREAGKFVVSGSANFLLMRAISESLAGRAVHIHLGPMTWREIRRARQAPLLISILEGDVDLDEYCRKADATNPTEDDWIRGGFPPAVLEPDDQARRLWFAGYEQTYLDRDLRDLTQVADLGLFERFLRLTALRTAQVQNIRDIARDCGSNPVTVSRWLSILETSFLIRRVSPFFSNYSKRLVKAPKLYCGDSGLASFLCGVHDGDALKSGPLRGAIAETYVCQNIAAILSAYLPEARLYHYRSHSGLEVDFIIECGERVIAVEVKSSSRVDARDLKALSEFVGREKRCVAGFVVHTGCETVRIGEKQWSLPLGILLG